MNLQQVGLYLRGSASPQDVTHAYVYQGSTLVGTVIFTGQTFSNNCPPANSSLGAPAGGCYFATTTVSSFQLQQNVQTNFTIKADIAPIGIAAPGTPGDQVVIGLSDAAAVGVNSGTIVHSGYAPDLVGVSIFKSYPSLAPAPLPGLPSAILEVGANALSRFSVSASPGGPIALGKLRFDMAIAGVNMSNFQLYAYTDPASSQPVSGTSNGLLGSVASVTTFADGGSGAGFALAQPLEIPAGATYYFLLVGTASNLQTSASVSTTLDGASSVGNPIVGPLSNFGYRFIWSDNATTTSTFTTNDWTNGFGVVGLPQSGLTQTLSTVVSTQGGITVSSAQQPANSLAFEGATIPFTKFTITNPTSGSLSVSGFIVHLFGLVSSQAFHDIRLFNNTAGGYQGIPVTFDSNGQADIGGQTTLLPGASDTFTVMGDMAADLSAYAGETAQIPLTGIDTSGTNTQINGTLPANGATQTINASLNACASPQTYGIQCWITPSNSGPTATLDPLPVPGLSSNGILERFKVTAGSAPTNIYDVLFDVRSNNQSVANPNATLALGVFSDPQYSIGVPGLSNGLFGTATLNGYSAFPVFNTAQVLIPSGTTYYFEAYDPVTRGGILSNLSTVTTQLISFGDKSGDLYTQSGIIQTRTNTNIVVSSPTVTYVSNSGGSVTGSYANLPAGSQIVAVNQTSGQYVTGANASVSGSGSVTLTGLPVGTFYLKALDGSGNYLAQSVSFTSSGSAQQTVSFTATPTSGTAPLSVAFSSTGAPGTDIGSTVEFGDGASGTLIPAPTCFGCNEYAAVGHTYVSSGTYTATLVNSSGTTLGTATIAVTNPAPPPSSTLTYVSNSGGSVTGSYANLPAGSQIVVINVTSNQPVSGVSAAVSGSGSVTLNSIPAGSFYLKAQDAFGNYLAQSVTFYSAGAVPPAVNGGSQNSAGFGGTSASVTPNANLANALTGLQSALQTLLQMLGK
jgi:hypothetical protein